MNNLTLCRVLLGVAVMGMLGAARSPQKSRPLTMLQFTDNPAVSGKPERISPNWSFNRRWSLRHPSPTVKAGIYASGWALSLRQARPLFWCRIADCGSLPRAWRLFAAYQLFVAHARPGTRFESLAKALHAASWLRHRDLRKVAQEVIPASIPAKGAFRIPMQSPAEPAASIYFALLGPADIGQVYGCIRGGDGSVGRERVLAIGIGLGQAERRATNRAPTVHGIAWLLAPKMLGARFGKGQTMDGWAIRNYSRSPTKPGLRRAIQLVLRMDPMPSAFWHRIAADRTFTKSQRFRAERLFLMTGARRGERLSELVRALAVGPRWTKSQINYLAVGPDFPIFHSKKAENGWLFLLRFHPPVGGNLWLSLDRRMTGGHIYKCLSGRGRKEWLRAKLLGVAPRWH